MKSFALLAKLCTVVPIPFVSVNYLATLWHFFVNEKSWKAKQTTRKLATQCNPRHAALEADASFFASCCLFCFVLLCCVARSAVVSLRALPRSCCLRLRRLLAPLLSCCQDFEWESCAARCTVSGVASCLALLVVVAVVVVVVVVTLIHFVVVGILVAAVEMK